MTSAVPLPKPMSWLLNCSHSRTTVQQPESAHSLTVPWNKKKSGGVRSLNLSELNRRPDNLFLSFLGSSFLAKSGDSDFAQWDCA